MEFFVIAILILIGTMLLAVEVTFIPGIGVTGILGVIAMCSAVAYSFICINTLAGWLALAIVVFLIAVLIIWAIYGKSIDKVALKKNIDSTVRNPEADTLKVGDTGVALARLALVGDVDFNGHIVEVASSDGFIEEGTVVTIARIDGGAIFVAKKKS